MNPQVARRRGNQGIQGSRTTGTSTDREKYVDSDVCASAAGHFTAELQRWIEILTHQCLIAAQRLIEESYYLKRILPGFIIAGVAVLSLAGLISALRAQSTPPIRRVGLLKRVLPAGNFRNVEAVVIELDPGAAAQRHRHVVAVLAYVIEGAVENRFDGGETRTHRPRAKPEHDRARASAHCLHRRGREANTVLLK